MDRAHAEFVLLGMLRLLPVFGGGATRVFAVRFEHARPAHHAEYTRVFAGAERFGQAETAIEFDAALLDRPYLHQQSRLYDLLLSQAVHLLSTLTGARGVVEQLDVATRCNRRRRRSGSPTRPRFIAPSSAGPGRRRSSFAR